MYSVKLMVEEHDHILKLLAVMRKACCGILEGQEIDDGDFYKMIAFARTYADKHHHGKEEQILFKEMLERLGQVGVNLIKHGMLVEHDLGRLHIAELEKMLGLYKKTPQTEYKLNILAEAIGYANLLQRHIDKENQVVYAYAEKNLSGNVLEEIDAQVARFEKNAEKDKIQQTCLQWLKELSEKYLCDLSV